MQVVILCGGRGTRLSNDTATRPKPLVEVGGKPILWHIMDVYARCGFNEFVVALGYKGHLIKEYFLGYRQRQSDLSIDLATGEMRAMRDRPQEWVVHLLDSGLETMTGGRLLRLAKRLKRETFMLTYGDGLGSINIRALLEFHRRHGKIATVTAVRPSARFGRIQFAGDSVVSFREKSQTAEGWINGGFFVFEPDIFRFLTDDDTILEREPMERLAAEGQLMGYRHPGFWQCMDTARERDLLNELAEHAPPPWVLAE